MQVDLMQTVTSVGHRSVQINPPDADAPLHDLVQKIRANVDASAEDCIQEYCSVVPKMDQKSVQRSIHAFLMDVVLDDRALLVELRDWIWQEGWVVSSPFPGREDDFLLLPTDLSNPHRLSQIDSELLTEIRRAHNAQMCTSSLLAYHDLRLEEEEAIRRVAEHLFMLETSSRMDPWRKELCRALWRHGLRIKAKASVMYELTNANWSSARCRFSSECGSCSTGCPRFGNDAGRI